MFEHFTPYPGDPILSLQQTYAADDRPDKVNLSIGLYYDEEGRIPQLESVRLAAGRVNSQDGPCVYLPMAGSPDLRRAIQDLLFGAGDPRVAAGHVATVQTVGGSGALKVGGDVLKKHFPDSRVWLSDPSWDNHQAVFKGCGFAVEYYPYFDPETRGVNFAAMKACLEKLPAREIVLLHPCCHNPTGADLTREQWDEVVEIVRSRNLLAFLDIAYQGFADGVEEDAYAVRAMAQAGLSFFVCNSFSKTFSLYGERCGGLSIVCADADEAARALGQMEMTVRKIYSSPPSHGAQIVSCVLHDAELKALWLTEVKAMRERMHQVRAQLHAALTQEKPQADFSHYIAQRGMFSYTGLSAQQVRDLRARFGIYMIESGRMCVAGLNGGNVQRVAQAFAQMA